MGRKKVDEDRDQPLLSFNHDEEEEDQEIEEDERHVNMRDTLNEPTQNNKVDTEPDNEEDVAPRRIFEINKVYTKEQMEGDRKFMSNRVTTTKYSCLSFLPKNLFE